MITSINFPTQPVVSFAALQDWTTVVIADQKTPLNWSAQLGVDWRKQYGTQAKPNLVFLSVEEQAQLGFNVLKVIPFKSYARKNIGYLYAVACGAKVIYETDDDNALGQDSTLGYLPDTKHINITAVGDAVSHTTNPYAYFGRPDIWPRGFPLPAIARHSHEFLQLELRDTRTAAQPLVQQGLADLDPDVDAIWRLTRPDQIGRVHFNSQPAALPIQPGFFSPYNSQNTMHLVDAFWGLLIPHSTSIRVCDIWRSYWVQRLLWDVHGELVFTPANVEQVRNPHEYLEDFEGELQLYRQAGSLIDFLYSWHSLEQALPARILQLAQDMADAGFWETAEIELVRAWLMDLEALGYPFPEVKPFMGVANRRPGSHVGDKSLAVCITGEANRADKALPATLQLLHQSMQAAARHQQEQLTWDVFVYASDFRSPQKELQWLTASAFAAVTVIYKDRHLTFPHVLSPDQFGLRAGISLQNWLQQHYGLQRCLDLVQDYAARHSIQYSRLMRLRTDHVLNGSADEIGMSVYNATDKICIPDPDWDFGGYNDRVAWGGFDQMAVYMSRYSKVQNASAQYFRGRWMHAESFLKTALDELDIEVDRLQDLSSKVLYWEVPHKRT